MLRFDDLTKVSSDEGLCAALLAQGISFVAYDGYRQSGDHRITGILRQDIRARVATYLFRKLNKLPHGMKSVMVLSPSSEELEWFNTRTSIVNRGGRVRKVGDLWKGFRDPSWLTARDVTMGLPIIPWEGNDPNFIVAVDTSPHMTISTALDTIPSYFTGTPMVVVAQYHSPSHDETVIYRFAAPAGRYVCRRHGTHRLENADGEVEEVVGEKDWEFKVQSLAFVEGRYTVYTTPQGRMVEQVASAEGTHYAHRVHTEFVDTKYLKFVWRGHELQFTSEVIRSNSLFQAHFSAVAVLGEALPQTVGMWPVQREEHVGTAFQGCIVLERVLQVPSVSSHQVVRDGRLSFGETYMEELFSGGDSKNAQTQRSRNTAMLRLRSRYEEKYRSHLNSRLITPVATTVQDHLRQAWKKSQQYASSEVAAPVCAPVLCDAASDQAHDQQTRWFETRLGLSPEISKACARITGSATVLEMMVSILDSAVKGATWLASTAWSSLVKLATKVASLFSKDHVLEEITLSALGHCFALAKTLLATTGWGKNLIKNRLDVLDHRALLSDDWRLAHPHISKIWDWSCTALMCLLTALVEEYVKRLSSIGAIFGLMEGLVHVVHMWIANDQDMTLEACGISVAVITGHFLGHLALLAMPILLAVPIHAIINLAQTKVGTQSWPLWRLVLRKLRNYVLTQDSEDLMMSPLVAPDALMTGQSSTFFVETEDGEIPVSAEFVEVQELHMSQYHLTKTVFLKDEGELYSKFSQPNGGPKDLFILEKARLAAEPPPFHRPSLEMVKNLKWRLWDEAVLAELRFQVKTPEQLFEFFLNHPVWTRSKKAGWLRRLVDVLDGAERERLTLFVKKDEILMAKLVDLGEGDWAEYLKVRPIHPGALTSVLVFAISDSRKESVNGKVLCYDYESGGFRVSHWTVACPRPTEICMVYLATTGPSILGDAYEALSGAAMALLTHGDDLYAFREVDGVSKCVPLDISMCDSSCREDNVHGPFREELLATAQGDAHWIGRCLEAYTLEMSAIRMVDMKSAESVLYAPTERKTATGSAATAQLAAFASTQSFYCFIVLLEDCRRPGNVDPADWPDQLIRSYAAMGFKTTGEWKDDWIPGCLGTFLGGRFLRNSKSGRTEWLGESPKMVISPDLRVYGSTLDRHHQVACHVLVNRTNSVLMAHPLYRSILDKMMKWVELIAREEGWDLEVIQVKAAKRWQTYLRNTDPYRLERRTEDGAVPFCAMDYQEVVRQIDDHTAALQGVEPPSRTCSQAFGMGMGAQVRYSAMDGCFVIDADISTMVKARYPG